MVTYPKGTTKEQWDQYTIDCARHKAHMELKRVHYEQVMAFIENIVTPEQMMRISSRLNSELAMADSCDAPNKPGYTIANND